MYEYPITLVLRVLEENIADSYHRVTLAPKLKIRPLQPASCVLLGFGCALIMQNSSNSHDFSISIGAGGLAEQKLEILRELLLGPSLDDSTTQIYGQSPSGRKRKRSHEQDVWFRSQQDVLRRGASLKKLYSALLEELRKAAIKAEAWLHPSKATCRQLHHFVLLFELVTFLSHVPVNISNIDQSQQSDFLKFFLGILERCGNQLLVDLAVWGIRKQAFPDNSVLPYASRIFSKCMAKLSLAQKQFSTKCLVAYLETTSLCLDKFVAQCLPVILKPEDWFLTLLRICLQEDVAARRAALDTLDRIGAILRGKGIHIGSPTGAAFSLGTAVAQMMNFLATHSAEEDWESVLSAWCVLSLIAQKNENLTISEVNTLLKPIAAGLKNECMKVRRNALQCWVWFIAMMESQRGSICSSATRVKCLMNPIAQCVAQNDPILQRTALIIWLLLLSVVAHQARTFIVAKSHSSRIDNGQGREPLVWASIVVFDFVAQCRIVTDVYSKHLLIGGLSGIFSLDSATISLRDVIHGFVPKNTQAVVIASEWRLLPSLNWSHQFNQRNLGGDILRLSLQQKYPDRCTDLLEEIEFQTHLKTPPLVYAHDPGLGLWGLLDGVKKDEILTHLFVVACQIPCLKARWSRLLVLDKHLPPQSNSSAPLLSNIQAATGNLQADDLTHRGMILSQMYNDLNLNVQEIKQSWFLTQFLLTLNKYLNEENCVGRASKLRMKPVLKYLPLLRNHITICLRMNNEADLLRRLLQNLLAFAYTRTEQVSEDKESFPDLLQVLEIFFVMPKSVVEEGEVNPHWTTLTTTAYAGAVPALTLVRLENVLPVLSDFLTSKQPIYLEDAEAALTLLGSQANVLCGMRDQLQHMLPTDLHQHHLQTILELLRLCLSSRTPQMGDSGEETRVITLSHARELFVYLLSILRPAVAIQLCQDLVGNGEEGKIFFSASGLSMISALLQSVRIRYCSDTKDKAMSENAYERLALLFRTSELSSVSDVFPLSKELESYMEWEKGHLFSSLNRESSGALQLPVNAKLTSEMCETPAKEQPGTALFESVEKPLVPGRLASTVRSNRVAIQSNASKQQSDTVSSHFHALISQKRAHEARRGGGRRRQRAKEIVANILHVDEANAEVRRDHPEIVGARISSSISNTVLDQLQNTLTLLRTSGRDRTAWVGTDLLIAQRLSLDIQKHLLDFSAEEFGNKQEVYDA